MLAAFGLLIITLFALALVPAFGPPSWLVVVYFRQHYGLPLGPLIVMAAAVTASGRVLLAHLFRRLRTRLPKRQAANIDAAAGFLARRQKQVLPLMILFVLSPLPSAQLFEAAGLLETPLVPLGLAFFAGRLVSYSIYLSISKVTINKLNSVLGAGLSSWVGIGIEAALMLVFFWLLNSDWLRRKLKEEL